MDEADVVSVRCAPRIRGCAPRAGRYLVPGARGLRDLLDHYRAHHWAGAEREAADFAEIGFDRALDLAGRGKLADGKHHPHLYRLSKAALDRGMALLRLRAARLSSAPDFASIHTELSSIAASVAGLSRMWVYDTAFALSASRGLRPNDLHLHRGTAEGARYFGVRGSIWRRRDWPSDFLASGLDGAHLENFLCMYRKDLRRLRSRASLPQEHRP